MNRIFNKIFMWLGIGLLLSFATAFLTSQNTNLLLNVFGKFYIWLVIIELGLAFVLGIFVRKLPKEVLMVLYIAYCIVTGFTLSSIFIIYQMNSIVLIFLITGLIFAGLSLYGYRTNKDITKIGTILFFGLIAIIIATVINEFLKSSTLDIVATIISILVFVGYIAYDTHLIKNKLYGIDDDKLVIYGAFQFYLDFINLFLDLLRLFGKGKD